MRKCNRYRKTLCFSVFFLMFSLSTIGMISPNVKSAGIPGVVTFATANDSEIGAYSESGVADCPSAWYSYGSDGGSNPGATLIRGGTTNDLVSGSLTDTMNFMVAGWFNPDYYPYSWPSQNLPPNTATITSISVKFVFTGNYIADYCWKLTNTTNPTYPFDGWSDNWQHAPLNKLGAQTGSPNSHEYILVGSDLNASVLKSTNVKIWVWFKAGNSDSQGNNSRMSYTLVNGTTHLDYVGFIYRYSYSNVGMMYPFYHTGFNTSAIQMYDDVPYAIHASVTSPFTPYTTAYPYYYAMCWNFTNNMTGSFFQPYNIFPDNDTENVTITSVVVTIKTSGFYGLQEGKFLVSWNFTGDSSGNTSDIGSYGDWISSDWYQKQIGVNKATNSWDITDLRNWSVAELLSWNNLRVVWVWKNITYYQQIDYVGISYTGVWTPHYFPNYLGGDDSWLYNIMGVIWLLIVFLPAILMNEVVPKIGFTAGMFLMLLVVGFTQQDFLGEMMIGMIGLAILLYKGV